MLAMRPPVFALAPLLAAALLAACGGSTTPACPIPGSVYITTNAEWDALVASGCDTIEGGLSISATNLVDLPPAPALRTIGSGLSISDNPSLRAIRLPALQTTGRCPLIMSNPAMTTLELPAFRSCSSASFLLDFNSALTAIELPALTTLPSGISATRATALTTVRMPALQSVTYFFALSGSDFLTTLELPEVTSISGQLILQSLPALATLSAPKLQLAGSIRLTRIGVGAPSFPALTTIDQDLLVSGNPSLTTLDWLAGLTSLGAAMPAGYLSFTVRDNPALPQCQAEALSARLAGTGFAGSAEISGNDAAATCP